VIKKSVVVVLLMMVVLLTLLTVQVFLKKVLLSDVIRYFILFLLTPLLLNIVPLVGLKELIIMILRLDFF
jgi:hypothetical protein